MIILELENRIIKALWVERIVATPEACKLKNRDLPLGVAYLLLLLDGCKEVQNQIFASTLTLS